MSSLRTGFGRPVVIGRSVVLAKRGALGVAVALGIGALVSAAVQMSGAKASRGDDDASRSSKVQPAAEPGIVRLAPGGAAKVGIETSAIVPVPYQDQVRAYGTVLALDGLAGLYNGALTSAAQVSVAEARFTAARVAKDRANNLLKVFATAKAQAEAADGAFDIESANLAAAKVQVETLRNLAVQDWGPVLGAAVAARTQLASDLVSRKTSLVQVSLPADAMAPGTAAPARVSLSLGGVTVEGRLVSEAARADPRTQSRGFFYVTAATAGLLPGAGVLATFPRGEAKPGVAIPPSAVVWQAGRPWMYLRTAPETFSRQPLDPAAAPTADGGYVVPGASVSIKNALVVTGAQILLSEESRAEIPPDENDN